MSNAESKKNILGYVCAALVLGLVFFAIAFLCFPKKEAPVNAGDETKSLPFSDFYINYSSDNEISFSATLTKEEFEAFLRDEGILMPKIICFLPEEVSVFCIAKVTGMASGDGVRVSIISAKVNEIEIPKKLLSDIGEINLDFKRSLGYN